MMKPREMVMSALLTALALLIPLAFRGWLQVYTPPFSATIASHVPSMLAMFMGPLPAALVGLGSTLGFAITLGPVIAARAFIHVIWGVGGAYLYRAGLRPWAVIAAIIPIHALGEALVVLPFGFSLYQAFVVVGIGTALHHAADGAIALSLLGALSRAGMRFWTPRVAKL